MIECFADKDADIILEYDGIKVLKYDEIKDKGKCYIVSPLVNNGGAEISKLLFQDGKEFCTDLSLIAKILGESQTVLEEQWVAFSHKNGFDTHFTNAENTLDTFWGDNSEFKKLFNKNDKTSIVEFACGRGRHVNKYIGEATKIILVDVLEENIAYCRERLQEETKISYLANNGKDLKGIPDKSCTSLFSYDAIVHFEMINIGEYLMEFNRVLVPGGRALLHHSDNHVNYKVSFANGESGRNYMSEELFAYMAYRNGFEVIEQVLIDWGEQRSRLHKFN